MAQQVSSARVTVDINGRRTSLPVFLSDSGKDIPNYLRASIGSCHDYCKYGKETVSVRQHRPWIKETAAASQVVFPTVKSAKISKNGKSKIISDVKISEDSFMSRDEDIKHSAEFTTISGSKLIKEKSFVKKTGAPSGTVKLKKLKRVVPAKVETRVGGKTSLDLNKGKRKVSMVNRSRAVKHHDTVAKSPIHPPKKMNAITRPPLPPSPSKLATKGKTSSSSTPPPVTPVTKLKPLPSANHLKTKSVVANSPSSSATKKSNAAALKAPPLNPRKASIKKILNFKDQNTKKRDASKTRVTKDAATRHGSKPHTSNTATNSKGKGLRLEKSVNVKLAETKEFHEKNEEVPSHAAESGYQEGMESYDEVPEKTLYVVEMETGNNTKAPSCHEYQVPTHSSLTSQPEVGQCELTDADKSLPSAEKISDTQLFIPSSTSSCAISNIQDDSTYTETEVDYIIHDDDHLILGANLKGAENAVLEDCNKDPVKLTFRRGTVIDITQQNNAPRRLKFTREHAVEENTANSEVRTRSFKITEATQDNGTTKNSSGTFVLRHQDVQDTKKDAKILFNNVIEETASKLAETRKSKVKALVGAFETVISLQDRKPAATS